MKVRLIVMCYDSEEFITQVIQSYYNFVSDVLICIDNKTTDNTLLLVKKFKKVKIFFFDFVDFSQARNLCLEESNKTLSPKDYNFFVDDSYTFTGVFPGTLTGLCYNVTINCENISYTSCRITRVDSELFYTGIIHEYIDTKTTCIIPGVSLLDLKSESHKQRTLKRLVTDMTLFDNSTQRGATYSCHTAMSLFNSGSGSSKEVIYYAIQRITMIDNFPEEKFLVLLILGLSDPRYFFKAAVVFPGRAGEAYFKAYKSSKNINHLKLAYKHRVVKNSVLQRNVKYQDLIEISYASIVKT